MRPLDPTLPALRENGAEKQPAQRLKALRQRHHLAAKMLAAGARQCDVCLHLGYTDAYLSTLKNDPAFQALLEHYSKQSLDDLDLMVERHRAIVSGAQNELLRRLEEDPKGFSDRVLVTITTDGADRFGQMRRTGVEVKDQRLADKLARALARAEGMTIDGTVVPAE